MNIYVASKANYGGLWKKYRDSHGVPISSTWIDEYKAGDTADLADLWDRCVREAAQCDAIVVYRKDETEILKGALVELGAALAFGKLAYLVGVHRTYDSHPLVTRCNTIDYAFSLALMRHA